MCKMTSAQKKEKQMAETIKYSEEGDFHYEKRRGGKLEITARSRYALAVAEMGSGTVSVRGGLYRFDEGDLIVMPEGAGYTLDCGEETRVALIVFRPYFLSEAMRGVLRSSVRVIRPERLGISPEALSAKIYAETKHPDELSRDLCRAYTAELCAGAARAAANEEDEAQRCPSVEAVLAYVRDHSGERLSLSEMADMCRVSTAYLSRKFKAEVGVGFADYVATTRLERAETMLRERPEMSVTEIAFMCGFNDSNYFSDKFKKHFGVSPLKFRKQA